MTYATREAWLQDAAGEIAPIIAAAGGTLPQALRVACGFPSTYRRSGALGETFAPADSADQTVEVLISPTLSDPLAVLAMLTRQLCHAAASGSARRILMDQIGIVDDKASTVPCVADIGLRDIASALGPYPHAELSLADRPKAATRLLKGLCPTCGYTIRLTKKWSDRGMPQCPCGDTFNLELGA